MKNKTPYVYPNLVHGAPKNIQTRRNIVDMLAVTVNIQEIHGIKKLSQMYWDEYGEVLPEDYAYEILGYIRQAQNEGKEYVGRERFSEFVYKPRS